MEVHGISNEFLADKPLFEHITQDFIHYIKGAELIIHNAPFDIGFLDYEISLHNQKTGDNYQPLQTICSITDSLVMARDRHPGQRNSLDALCKRYGIDNSHRDLHGALLDAEILADVYLLMTGGQSSLLDEDDQGQEEAGVREIKRISSERAPLKIIRATDEELRVHQLQLDSIAKVADRCLWQE
jgi:DNA polymerase-3 subunit epsilon